MTVSVMQPISNALRSVNKAINWLLYTREELNLRARDQRMQALYQKTNMTSQDLLRADFGTDNPNGLAVRYPDYQCYLKDLKDMPGFKKLDVSEKVRELNRVDGRAGVGPEIYLNPRYDDKATFKSEARNLANVIAHEHVHRLQGAEREAGWNSSAFSNRNMLFLHVPLAETGLWGKAKTLYQDFRRAAADKKAFKETDFKVSDYFSNETEIQARMHEALAQGYAGWQRMPANKQELWAAFHNMGLKTPPAILAELNSSPSGQQALKDFRASSIMRHSVRPIIRDLNYLHDYAAFSDKRQTLWRHSLPAMYGNLLELYGDEQGRARLDLGPNPQAAKHALRILQQTPENVTKDNAAALIADVPPEWANEIVFTIAQNYPEDSASRDKAMNIVDALFEREETRVALLSRNELKMAGACPGMPAWWFAIHQGDTAILQRYLQAGHDFTQNISIYGHNEQKIGENNLLRLARQQKIKKEELAGENTASADLKDRFNDSARRQALRQHVRNMDRSFQFISAHHPDPEIKREFVTGQSTEFKAFGQIAAEAGTDIRSVMADQGAAAAQSANNAQL